MRLRDVIQVVSSIEIPLPGAADDSADGPDQEGGDQGFSGDFSGDPPLAA
jgi:hypothetical protein